MPAPQTSTGEHQPAVSSFVADEGLVRATSSSSVGRPQHATLCRSRRPACLPLIVGTLLGCAPLATCSASAWAGGVESASINVYRGQRAESCRGAPETIAAIEAVLGRRVFLPVANGAQVRIEVRYQHRGGRFLAGIVASGAKEGSRVVEDDGATCDALSDAVAVMVALLLDNVVVRPMRASSVSEAPRAPGVSAGIEAVAGLTFGLLSRASPQLALAFPVRLGRSISLAAGGTASLERSLPFGAGSVNVWLGFGFVRACGMLTPESSLLDVSFCLRPAVGVLHGRGEGFPITGGASFFWLSIALGPELRRDFGSSFYVALHAYAVLPARTQSFVVGNVGEAYHSPSVAAEADAAFGWRLF